MTPRQILRDMPLAIGLQLEAQWWIEKGYEVEHAALETKPRKDRLRA